MKTLFMKLEYQFLVESNKIENAILLHKTVISEANVKTNRMGSTKWNYYIDRRFPSNCFIVLKILLEYKTL